MSDFLANLEFLHKKDFIYPITRIPLHANMRQLPALICCDRMHGNRSVRLRARPSGTEKTNNHSVSGGVHQRNRRAWTHAGTKQVENCWNIRLQAGSSAETGRLRKKFLTCSGRTIHSCCTCKGLLICGYCNAVCGKRNLHSAASCCRRNLCLTENTGEKSSVFFLYKKKASPEDSLCYHYFPQ